MVVVVMVIAVRSAHGIPARWSVLGILSLGHALHTVLGDTIRRSKCATHQADARSRVGDISLLDVCKEVWRVSEIRLRVATRLNHTVLGTAAPFGIANGRQRLCSGKLRFSLP